MSSRPLRADAQRSRDAIIDAYTRLARERGDSVPLYEVAREAKVGQGTLYRHFRTRAALAAAVFGQVLDELEALARDSPSDPHLFERLLDAALHTQITLHGLSRVLVAGAAPELADLSARTLNLFAPALRLAQSDGRVRDDLQVTDVTTMLSMVDGVLNGVGGELDRQRGADRAIELILDGTRSRG